MPKPVTILRGLPIGSEAAAAALFWQSFSGKFTRFLGPDARGIGFFTATINPDRVISALDQDGALLGILSFKMDGQGFSSARLRDLFRHYGAGALWRMIPLAMLDSNAPGDTLMIDGICVAPPARGCGVGTALLADLFRFAADHGFVTVALEVVDSNPRARALYERLGFRTVAAIPVGPLRHLVGFHTATRMECPVAAAKF